LVRLFPLPNLVMFPSVIKGLHIFEPRYCKMLEETLSTDKLIAMALLMPGWEAQYLNRPPIHDVVCVGKVVQSAQTSEGRHNILLYGQKRARIVQERATSHSDFRRAEVILMDDLVNPPDCSVSPQLAESLLGCFRRAFPNAYFFTIFPIETVRTISLGFLTDLIAYELPMTFEEKQALLSEPVVQNRAERLLKFLGNGGSANGKAASSRGGRPLETGDGYSSGFSLN
jgi:Lon protease-like protein